MVEKIGLKQLNEQKESKALKIAFFAILAIGVLARVLFFWNIPNGINQDEAFAGYNAYSLLKYGIDTSGYAFPVYFTAWGSGMNALETYLAMPFVAIFGLTAFSIRIPQLITGIFSVVVIYKLVEKYSNKYQALLAMLILAICPWHVMLSRWGLESNLAPGFILFGTYFFVLGLDKKWCLPLSALFYGLALYSYATVWIYLPILIAFELLYALISKKLKIDWYLVAFVLILFLLALPLLLFVAVNLGIMEEVKTAFFSIPKLLYFRGDEVSFAGILENAKQLFSIIFRQTDNLEWNSPEKFGLLYHISTPFMIIGFIYEVVQCVKSIKKKQFRIQNIVLVMLILALLCSITLSPNVNRVNIVFIPIILLISSGIYISALSLTQKNYKKTLAVVFATYLLFFGLFEGYYFTDYAKKTEASFASGLKQSVARSKEVGGDLVYVSSEVFYSSILFYDKTDVNDFIDTVNYAIYPSPYLDAVSFTRYYFADNFTHYDKTALYVVHEYYKPFLQEQGFTVEDYGTYVFAYYK